MAPGNQEYKDRLFSFMFGNGEHKEWTLSLYNAVNGTDYTNPDDISIQTIRQVLYLGMHDDVAFIIADTLSLYEQQSTFNPNMPVRMLEYTANLMEKYIRQNSLNKYSRRLISLPVPKLVVFYNGLESEPDESTLSLSDAFPANKRESSDIDVRVRMINVNLGHSEGLMERCKPLDEYAWIVGSIRELKQSRGLEEAIDGTIDRMPGDFMTKPFLQAHRAEVKNMLLTEYNEAETLELFKEEGRVEGLAEGRTEGRAEGRDSALIDSIRSLMRSLKLTAQQAMELLNIPAEEQPRFLEKV